jgi:hypothetical protein
MVCMRLSLKRAAHVLLASSARQEIRVGMTRGEWLLSVRLATWMDGI